MWPSYDQVSWSVSVFNLTQTRVTGKYEPYMGTVFIALVWHVGRSMRHFLDCLFMQEGPAYCEHWTVSVQVVGSRFLPWVPALVSLKEEISQRKPPLPLSGFVCGVYHSNRKAEWFLVDFSAVVPSFSPGARIRVPSAQTGAALSNSPDFRERTLPHAYFIFSILSLRCHFTYGRTISHSSLHNRGDT